MFAQARERHMESGPSGRGSSPLQVVRTETQAEAVRFTREREQQAHEVLASATEAVSQAEAKSRDSKARANFSKSALSPDVIFTR